MNDISEFVKDGCVKDNVLKAHSETSGVPDALSFVGFDDEAGLLRLRKQSRELGAALYASRPCPLEIVRRHSEAQGRLAAQALRLVEAYKTQLQNELDAARADVVRCLTAGLKVSGRSRELALERLARIADNLAGGIGPLERAHIMRLESVGLTVGRLRENTKHPIWLAECLSATSSVDPVGAWRKG